MPKRKYHIVNMGVGIEARFNLNRMFRERGEAKATCNGVLVCRYQQNLLGLLKTFQTAKVLEVCSWCIQVLSILKVRQQEILLFEAAHLVLNTGLNGWELPGIALLLRACRKLENLVIVMNDEAEELQFNDAFQRIYAFKQEFYWKNQGASSTVCLQRLAVVEFRISHGDKFFRVTDNDIRGLETWKNNSIEKQFFPEDTIQGYSAGAELLRFLRSKSVNLGKLIFTTKKQ